ncbi:hypothetical protein ACFWPK_32090 [Nocardia sp. NPDC058519]|uniref:hypothetical protein n=1 Tax=Nocardia sp. NPDC058519 TaxID=3346535 RepID=UPI003651163C
MVDLEHHKADFDHGGWASAETMASTAAALILVEAGGRPHHRKDLMAWNSAGDTVFGPIAEILLKCDAPPEFITSTLTAVIDGLFHNDWGYDGALSSLAEFANHPAVVAAFRNNAVPDPDDPEYAVIVADLELAATPTAQVLDNSPT